MVGIEWTMGGKVYKSESSAWRGLCRLVARMEKDGWVCARGGNYWVELERGAETTTLYIDVLRNK